MLGWPIQWGKIENVLRREKIDLALFQEWPGSTPGWAGKHEEESCLYGANKIQRKAHHGNAIWVNRGTLRLIGNWDISAHRFEKRGLLLAEWNCGERNWLLGSAHFALDHGGRQRQARRVIEIIETKKTAYDGVILGGDFNEPRHWMAELFATAGFKEACHEFQEAGRSFPVFRPTLRLDRIYGSGGLWRNGGALTDTECRRISDHLPVVGAWDPK